MSVMTLQSLSAMDSFEQLVDLIPEWQTTVTELIAHVSRRHEEFKAEYSMLLEKVEKRKRTGSICSIRSTDDQSSVLSATEAPRVLAAGNPTEVTLLETGSGTSNSRARTKRCKLSTSVRSMVSLPRKFRNKSKVVIQYDKHVQVQLEKLVKGFGTGRNNLRKGKNAYVASRGFGLPSLSRTYRSNDVGMTPFLSKPSGTVVTTVSSVTDCNVVGEAAFVSADKELEAAQQSCETAAHQAIRDGDCQLELKDVLVKLETLRVMAVSAIESLKAEDKKRADQEAQQAMIERISKLTGTNLPLKPAKCKMPPPCAARNPQQIKPLAPATDIVAAADCGPKNTISPTATIMASSIIEVDSIAESTESSVDLNLNIALLRSAARTRIRA